MKAECDATTGSGNAPAEQGLRKLAPLFAGARARAPSAAAKSEGGPAPNKAHGTGAAPAVPKPTADTKQEPNKAAGNGILQFLRPIGIKGGSAASASAPSQHEQAVKAARPGQQGNGSKPATAGAAAAPGTFRPRPSEVTAAIGKSEGKKPQLLAALPPLPLALPSLPRQGAGAQGATTAPKPEPAQVAVTKAQQARQPQQRTYQRRQPAKGGAGRKQGSGDRDRVDVGGDEGSDDEIVSSAAEEEEGVEEAGDDSSGEEYGEGSGEESESDSGSDWAPSPDANKSKKGAAGERTRPSAAGTAVRDAGRGGKRVQGKAADGDAATEGGARGGGKAGRQGGTAQAEGAAGGTKRKRAVQPPLGSAEGELGLEGGAAGRSAKRPVGAAAAAAGGRGAAGAGGGGAVGLCEEKGSGEAGRGRSVPLPLPVPRLSLKLVEPRVVVGREAAGGAGGGGSEEGGEDEGGGVLAKRSGVRKARALKSTGAYGSDGLDDTGGDDSPDGNGVAVGGAADVDEGDVQPGGVAATAGAVPLVLGKAAVAAARRAASAATAVLLQLPPTFDLQGDVGVIGRVCPLPGALAALGTSTSTHADGGPASQEAPSDVLTSQDASLDGGGGGGGRRGGGGGSGGGGGGANALAEAVLSAGGLGLDLKGEVLRLRHVPLPGAAMVVRMDAKGGKVTSAEVERVFGTAIIAVPHDQEQQQQQRPGAGLAGAGAGARRAAADDGMDVDSLGDPYGDPYGWAGEDSGDEGGVGRGGGVRTGKGGGTGGEGQEDGEEEGEEGKGGKGGKGGKRGGGVRKARGGGRGRGGVRVGKGAAGGKRKPAGRGRGGRGGGKAGGKKK